MRQWARCGRGPCASAAPPAWSPPISPRYTRPAETPDVLQWGSIPYDEALRSFGFKATPRAADRCAVPRRLATPVGPRRDRRDRFHRGPNRTLMRRDSRHVRAGRAGRACRPRAGAGRERQRERVGHAAGGRPGDRRRRSTPAPCRAPRARSPSCGSTRFAAASAGSRTIPTQRRPRRGDDVARHDRRGHGQDRRHVPHRESRRTRRRSGRAPPIRIPNGAPARSIAALVRGHFLNDLHLAVCLRRARDTGWVVRTNPYEGGSDHTVFTRARRARAAQLALHRSLLPHQSRHAGQDQRRDDAQRGDGRGDDSALFLASADASRRGRADDADERSGAGRAPRPNSATSAVGRDPSGVEAVVPEARASVNRYRRGSRAGLSRAARTSR